ncbi:MAG TPA: hypothetical protein VFT91_09440 [Dehalococcoidia bacterium]|nr:hypothetical protein [Dehalococcoidia bacterium]
MNWHAFAQATPELAALGKERFDRTGIVLVGSTRKDGTARISPVEHFIFEGELYLGMMWQSRKALDLLRDPRCVVHSAVIDKNDPAGEFQAPRPRRKHRRPGGHRALLPGPPGGHQLASGGPLPPVHCRH